ncbi:hypothetical protein RRG08_006625 [Elysia crispata]|uniref:Telomerase reverse transcriptase n=1 Tax=Elysia crispata TaxID=231223 RepID=A0AAE0YWN9_9GAST|nr:hypothetical protein RRG08_006625 [Elysia crispata]
MKERLIPTYLAAPEESGQMDFPFIGEMVKNHRKCPYLTLLRQICPCSQDLARNQMKRKKKKQTCPATSENVPVKDVFLFVRRVFLKGARISSLLCAAYFGYMDKTACAEFLGPHNFLIRMTDDMLFVTPHKETAKMFLQLMLDGVPAMKCISNFSKCLINFSYCHSILGEVPSICDDEPVKYCGICINPKTLEISVDYSNFKGKDRVPVSWELIHNSGAVLQKKILNSVNPQSFSILFDTDINSQQQINYNILCKFAVCSVKFHYLVMKLPAKQRALNNPSFFTRVVQSLPDHFYMLVTKALKKVSKDFKKDLSLPVSKATLRSLCNLTFLYKLQRHHAAYAFVIDNLLRVEKRKRLNSELRKKLSVVFDSINLKY